MQPQHLSHWLALSCTPGIGYKTYQRWLESFPDLTSVFSATHQELTQAGFSPKEINRIKHPDWRAIERAQKWSQEVNHHIITFADKDYPLLLKEIPDPPLILYVKGNKQALSLPQIAMVGSRSPTPAGLQTAERFAIALAEAGLAITSGLASGIDAASHRGALQRSQVTLAIFGTGLQHIYPESNCSLAQDIVANNGALISEFSLETPPRAGHFPRRNRIISGLSLGVLVVEAALRSGSLVTARNAAEQGRDVFAIPGSIHHPLSKGCHQLIRQGAKLVEIAEDILEELKGWQRSNVGSMKLSVANVPPSALDLPGKHLLSHIDFTVTALDTIQLHSRLTSSELSSMLLALELEGYIKAVVGGYVRTII